VRACADSRKACRGRKRHRRHRRPHPRPLLRRNLRKRKKRNPRSNCHFKGFSFLRRPLVRTPFLFLEKATGRNAHATQGRLTRPADGARLSPARRAHPVRGKGRAHLQCSRILRTFFQPDSGGLQAYLRKEGRNGCQAATGSPEPGAVQEAS
jgi:hypothetical protein